MKINFKKLHAQRKNQKPHERLSLCWSFYCVNDNAKVDLENTQVCILSLLLEHVILNPRLQAYVKDEGSNLNVMTTTMNANAMGFIHFNVHP